MKAVACVVGLVLGGVLPSVVEAVPSAAIVRFRTPSGVTICGATRFRGERPILRCNTVLHGLPPRPRSWEFEWGGGLEMDNRGRPAIVCASDSGFSPYGAPILRYGQVWHHFTFTCRSSPTGLTCRNPAGHGWFLSRRSWSTF